MISKDIVKTLKVFPKSYFSLNDARKFYHRGKSSIGLSVILSRLIKRGELERIMRGYYAFDLLDVDYEALACQLKKPSYLSFEYALYHHGMINQVIEALTLATTQKSRTLLTKEKMLEYTHLKSSLYFGYEIVPGALMATPEKALLDELYLISLKKRSLSLDDIDASRINRKRFFEWLKKYPIYTKRLAKRVVR